MLSIQAAVENRCLRIEVTNTGSPVSEHEIPQMYEKGIGIGNTRRRLEHLYDGCGELKLLPNLPGGLKVRISIPWSDHEGNH